MKIKYLSNEMLVTIVLNNQIKVFRFKNHEADEKMREIEVLINAR